MEIKTVQVTKKRIGGSAGKMYDTDIKLVSSPSDEVIKRKAKMQDYFKVLIIALIIIVCGPNLEELEQDTDDGEQRG